MNIYTSKFTAFVYRWKQKSTGKWYIGVRSAKNCHINDGYTCSSKIVKPLIESNPGDWSREILAMGESKFMVQLESEILQELDAKNDPDSYNLHNGDSKYSYSGCKHSKVSCGKIAEANRRRGPRSEATKAKQRAAAICRYQNLSTEEKEKYRAARRGKTHNEETKKKIGEAIIAYYQNLRPEEKEKYRVSHLGKTNNEETKKKMSVSAKNKPMYACYVPSHKEYSRNIWVQNFNEDGTPKLRKHSDETKRKMSEAHRGKKHNEENCAN